MRFGLLLSSDRQDGIPSAQALQDQLALHPSHHRTPDTDRIDVGFDRGLEGRFILGRPADCIAEIERDRAPGVQKLIMPCQWPGTPGEADLEAIRRFGQDVIPHIVVSTSSH